jgi:hypothetical protein
MLRSILVFCVLVSTDNALANASQDECFAAVTGCLKPAIESGACNKHAALDQDVDIFLRGGQSLVGQLFDEFSKRGKLDAVLEHLRKKNSFKSTDGYGLVKWGWSVRDVRKAYPKAKPMESGELSVGPMSIAGLRADLIFVFAANKLVGSRIEFDQAHSLMNPDAYVRDYHRVSDLLSEKYGEPSIDTGGEVSEDNLIEQGARVIGGDGRAIRRGSLELRDSWTKDKTKIELSLTGGDGKMHHVLEYASVELAELKEVAEKNALMERL